MRVTSENLLDEDEGNSEQIAVTAPIWITQQG